MPAITFTFFNNYRFSLWVLTNCSNGENPKFSKSGGFLIKTSSSDEKRDNA